MVARPALAALLFTCLCATAQAADRPHIVVLMPDDLGWQDLGYLGKEIRTPHIDALADGAIRLNQFYVQAQSSQTRAALMTALPMMKVWRLAPVGPALGLSVVSGRITLMRSTGSPSSPAARPASMGLAPCPMSQ